MHAANPIHLDKLAFFTQVLVQQHGLGCEVIANRDGSGYGLYITPPDAEAGFGFALQQQLQAKLSFHMQQMGLAQPEIKRAA